MKALTRGGMASEALGGSPLRPDAASPEETPWGVDFHAARGAGGPLGAGVALDRPTSWDVTPVPADARPEDEAALDHRLARVEGSRTDIMIGCGGGQSIRKMLARARALGLASVFRPQSLLDDPADADAVLVPTRFAANYIREAYGRECVVLPNLIDHDRVRVERSEPKYLTFVNPSVEKGVWAFARIADELGRRRPDIPILVVEARGTEADVAACGLDLRRHGNVFFMANTPDPRRFWRVTRACLMPSLGWESQGLAAVEAMVNGIPVVASDRGALPETLGEAGVVLPLPDRLTPATRWLPTAEEVEPWVEAVIRLWDDPAHYEDQRRRALGEARRWAPEVLEPQYVAFFEGLRGRGDSPRRTRRDSEDGSECRRSSGAAPPSIIPGRARAVVLVPHLSGIVWECEQALRGLEQEGVRVIRREGCSAIDVARNELASEALHDGAEAVFFIDADLGFEPRDALRLLARPEPVVSGVYAKKGPREMASRFADGIEEVRFGTSAFGPYPLKYAAAGFLRVKTEVLRRMIEVLGLPLCNTRWGRGSWPFFRPEVVPDGAGDWHYLGEDWAFSHRLGQLGVTPLADTSIRLWHFGRYAFGWEDAGSGSSRYGSYTYRIGDRPAP